MINELRNLRKEQKLILKAMKKKSLHILNDFEEKLKEIIKFKSSINLDIKEINFGSDLLVSIPSKLSWRELERIEKEFGEYEIVDFLPHKTVIQFNLKDKEDEE